MKTREQWHWGSVFAAVTAMTLLSGALVASETKESYLQKANQELREWNVKVDELQKRSEKAGAQTRQKLDRGVVEVRQSLAVVSQKLTKVEGSSESEWEKFRHAADRAFKDVKRTYREATSFLDTDKHKD